MSDESIPVGAAVTRHDGWTMERQLAFIEVLARTGSVSRASAAVGMSVSSAYRARGRLETDIFGYGWKSALAMAYYNLRDIALDRIDNGLATPSTYQGEVVTTKTVFNDRLLMSMLNHLKPELGTVGPTGLRRPTDDPGRAYAATVEAYSAGIEGGFDPGVPDIDMTGCVNGCEPPEPMTREEFMALISARPRSSELPRFNDSARP